MGFVNPSTFNNFNLRCKTGCDTHNAEATFDIPGTDRTMFLANPPANIASMKVGAFFNIPLITVTPDAYEFDATIPVEQSYYRPNVGFGVPGDGTEAVGLVFAFRSPEDYYAIKLTDMARVLDSFSASVAGNTFRGTMQLVRVSGVTETVLSSQAFCLSDFVTNFVQQARFGVTLCLSRDADSVMRGQVVLEPLGFTYGIFTYYHRPTMTVREATSSNYLSLDGLPDLDLYGTRGGGFVDVFSSSLVFDLFSGPTYVGVFGNDREGFVCGTLGNSHPNAEKRFLPPWLRVDYEEQSGTYPFPWVSKLIDLNFLCVGETPAAGLKAGYSCIYDGATAGLDVIEDLEVSHYGESVVFDGDFPIDLLTYNASGPLFDIPAPALGVRNLTAWPLEFSDRTPELYLL